MQRGYSDTDLDVAQAAFDLAVKSVGSKTKLAKRLGISKAAVMQWSVVPVGRARAVSSLSGVPIEKLCPGKVVPV